MKALGDLLGDRPTHSMRSSIETDAPVRRVESEPPCMHCGGARFVRVTADPEDPRFGQAVPCRCVRQEDTQERRDRLTRYSRLGALRRLTFETLLRSGRSSDPRAQRAYAEAVAIAERYARQPEGWLVLSGAHGSGKTHIAAAIANAVIERGDPALFVTVADLLDHLRSAYADDAEIEYDALFEQVRNAPLLILDDLDAYAETAWAREKFFQLVSHRFNAALPTVFTAVRQPADLDARLAVRLTDPALAQVVDLGGEAQPAYVQVGAMTRERLAAFTFDNFIPDGVGLTGPDRKSLEGAYRRAVTWSRDPKGWFVLLGKNGSGKTHLAAAIANERLAKGDRVAFANVPDLLDELRAAYAPDARRRYDDIFRTLAEMPVLILDDLGAQKSSPWAEEKLYQLLNHRHLARALTVITSNVHPKDMEPRIASRIGDRDVSEMSEITAPDFRLMNHGGKK